MSSWRYKIGSSTSRLLELSRLWLMNLARLPTSKVSIYALTPLDEGPIAISQWYPPRLPSKTLPGGSSGPVSSPMTTFGPRRTLEKTPMPFPSTIRNSNHYRHSAWSLRESLRLQLQAPNGFRRRYLYNDRQYLVSISFRDVLGPIHAPWAIWGAGDNLPIYLCPRTYGGPAVGKSFYRLDWVLH